MCSRIYLQPSPLAEASATDRRYRRGVDPQGAREEVRLKAMAIAFKTQSDRTAFLVKFGVLTPEVAEYSLDVAGRHRQGSGTAARSSAIIIQTLTD